MRAFLQKIIGRKPAPSGRKLEAFDPRREILVPHQRVTQFLKENGL